MYDKGRLLLLSGGFHISLMHTKKEAYFLKGPLLATFPDNVLFLPQTTNNVFSYQYQVPSLTEQLLYILKDQTENSKKA